MISRRRLPAVLLAATLALPACTSEHGPPPVAVGPVTQPATPPVTAAAPGHRPNVVLVLTDDLSTDLLRYMPHVRALQAAGTTMANYFVVDSLCCPSRSAIFTGLYPHDNGVFTNHSDDGGYSMFNHRGNPKRTFAVSLDRAGYRTALMGKYLNGYHPPNPVPPGWDQWYVAGNGYPEYDYTLDENGTTNDYGRDPKDYLTSVLSAKARAFMSTSTSNRQPFALEVATFAPHLPAVPAPQDVGTFPTLTAPHPPTYDRLPTHPPAWLARNQPLALGERASIDQVYRRRVESVQAVDRMVGDLRRTLVGLGIADNTYLVFSSDNGFHTGQYRMLPGKQTAYDTDIRVPLIVQGPGVPAGRVVTAPAASIDLAETFEQIAGATPSGMRDGVSLLDLWHGRPAPGSWQRAVLIEHHGGPTSARIDPDVQPARAGNPPSYEAMRTARFLYVEYRGGEREFYDLVRDPAELANLGAALAPAVAARLHAELQALSSCHGVAACQAAARGVT